MKDSLDQSSENFENYGILSKKSPSREHATRVIHSASRENRPRNVQHVSRESGDASVEVTSLHYARGQAVCTCGVGAEGPSAESRHPIGISRKCYFAVGPFCSETLLALSEHENRSRSLTLRLRIARNLYVVCSLGPKACRYESLEPSCNAKP